MPRSMPHPKGQESSAKIQPFGLEKY